LTGRPEIKRSWSKSFPNSNVIGKIWHLEFTAWSQALPAIRLLGPAAFTSAQTTRTTGTGTSVVSSPENVADGEQAEGGHPIENRIRVIREPVNAPYPMTDGLIWRQLLPGRLHS